MERADFMRFLCDWQHLSSATRMRGAEALAGVLGLLEGFQAAAGAWEGELLPARVADYGINWLDDLCRSGRIAWSRLAAPARPPAARCAARRSCCCRARARGSGVPAWHGGGRRALAPSRAGARGIGRAGRPVLRRVAGGDPPAAQRTGGLPRRTGGPGPGQCRQLRRPALVADARRPAQPHRPPRAPGAGQHAGRRALVAAAWAR